MYGCIRGMLRLAGARTVRVTPHRSARVEELHGVVLAGGADIDPARYGQPDRLPSRESAAPDSGGSPRFSFPDFRLTQETRREMGVGSAPVDRLRDSLEFELLAQALARDLPVLGICRGLQLINVHFGGTLHQDVWQLVPPTRHRFTLLPSVRLNLAKGSRFAGLLGPGIHRVNRLHRQAVDRLGATVRTAAWDGGGLVQAIEVDGPVFCYGVQWHPEYLPYVRTQRRLFGALVSAARQAIVPHVPW